MENNQAASIFLNNNRIKYLVRLRFALYLLIIVIIIKDIIVSMFKLVYYILNCYSIGNLLWFQEII